jgi:hypothetical protein
LLDHTVRDVVGARRMSPATPPRHTIAGSKRRSSVPGFGTVVSNPRSSEQSQATPSSPRPPLSPKTFGVQLPLETDYETPVRGSGSVASPSAFTTTPSSTNQLSADSPAKQGDRRDSAAVSFIHDFPHPPTATATGSAVATMALKDEMVPEEHASAFGQVVTGPPGAGKTTYCHGMHQVSLCDPFSPLTPSKSL